MVKWHSPAAHKLRVDLDHPIPEFTFILQTDIANREYYVYLRKLNGTVYALRVSARSTILELKKQHFEDYSVPVKEQVITY